MNIYVKDIVSQCIEIPLLEWIKAKNEYVKIKHLSSTFDFLEIDKIIKYLDTKYKDVCFSYDKEQNYLITIFWDELT